MNLLVFNHTKRQTVGNNKENITFILLYETRVFIYGNWGVCVVNNNTQTKIISNRVESSPSSRSSVPTDIYIYNFPPLYIP